VLKQNSCILLDPYQINLFADKSMGVPESSPLSFSLESLTS